MILLVLKGIPGSIIIARICWRGADGGGNVEMDEIDPIFVDSARIVVINQQGSASLLVTKTKKLDTIVLAELLINSKVLNYWTFSRSKAREVLFSDLTFEVFLRSKDLV